MKKSPQRQYLDGSNGGWSAIYGDLLRDPGPQA